MTRMKVFAAVWIVAVCLVGLDGKGVTAPAMSLPELVEKADLAFVGTAVESVSAWNPEHTRIYTRTTFRVQEYLKGSGGETLVIETLGGVVGDVGLMAPGMPAFQVGGKELLFVTTSPRTGKHHVLGWAQGRFRIEQEPGTEREILSRRLEGVTFAGQAPPGKPVDTIRYLDDMKRAIRQLLAGDQPLLERGR